MFICIPKLTPSLTSFLRYCKDTANLLFWELQECLIIPIKSHSINLQETYMLICMQKINFFTHFSVTYPEILGEYRLYLKSLVLGSLEAPTFFPLLHLQKRHLGHFPVILSSSRLVFLLFIFYRCQSLVANTASAVLIYFLINSKVFIQDKKALVIINFGHAWCVTKSDAINLKKTFIVCLQVKNQLHLLHFSEDITQICKLLILGSLGMPGYIHPK